MFHLRKTIAAASLALAFASGAEAATAVDTELSLLIDISGSVNTTEFDLQRQGYVDAFKNAAIQSMITDTDGGTRLGKIAVNVIYWASNPVEVMAWTLIDSAASATTFADTLAGIGRPGAAGSLTGPGNAINHAVTSLNANDYVGASVVIDVSGDGSQNTGADTATARDAALAAGVDRINGVAILVRPTLKTGTTPISRAAPTPSFWPRPALTRSGPRSKRNWPSRSPAAIPRPCRCPQRSGCWAAPLAASA